MAARLSKRTRDIWSIPPGGLPAESKRPNLKPLIAFGLVVALGIGGSLMYASMKKSTAVSAADALAEFQAAGEASPSSGSTAAPRANKRPSKKVSAGKENGPRGTRNKAAGAVAAAGGSSPQARRSQDATDRAPAEAEAPKKRTASQREPGPPDDGVYTWSVDGYEQAPGIRRDLPSRSHRVITHQGDDQWTEHHIFSEQREQWMEMTISPEGVAARSVRNRVEMGPVEVDNTIVFNPVMFVARYPSKIGQTWRGSWSGKTSGSYTARTFERTTVVIEGEEVEVYASEVIMDMRGEVQGRAITRSWYSLEHRMVVKQYQKMDVQSGPGDYRSEWTGQVLSLTPQR